MDTDHTRIKALSKYERRVEFEDFLDKNVEELIIRFVREKGEFPSYLFLNDVVLDICKSVNSTAVIYLERREPVRDEVVFSVISYFTKLGYSYEDSNGRFSAPRMRKEILDKKYGILNAA